MLKAMENALHKVNAPIAKWTANLAGFMLLVMTVIVLIQVAFRYILNTPLSWTDESSRFLMIYMTYLCLPLIYLDERNIAMSFVTDKLKGTRIYELLMAIAHVTAIVLFVVWVYYGFIFFKTGSVSADSLPIPMYVIYAAPPVMLTISIFSALEKLAGSLHNLFHFESVKQQMTAAEAAE